MTLSPRIQWESLAATSAPNAALGDMQIPVSDNRVVELSA
jgi:hypothetical protein